MKAGNLKIYSVHDKEFKNYGRVYNFDCSEIIEMAGKIELPKCGASYVPSEATLEKASVNSDIKREVFGNMPIQVGFCWGYNDTMAALEWHKNSEINIACTDMLIFVAKYEQLDDNFEINSDKVMAFVAKKGDCFEMFATTLHYCPCHLEEGYFRCVVILPEGTNTDLIQKCDDKLIFANNKWLICHDKEESLLSKGAFGGVHGENYKVEL